MPALSDSHPAKWVYDLHTQLKHRSLTNYLRPWIVILSSGSHSLAYVDGFAGRGRYDSGESGSPLLVLDAMANYLETRNPAQRFVCHFVEADKDNFANLKAEVERHHAVQAGRLSVRLYNSTFSVASKRIIEDIRRQNQPSFFFVDPFGYDDPTMDVLGEIMRLDKSEVLVNLMFNFANRAMSIDDNPALADILDRLFGTRTWRSLAALTGMERERGFVELYREQLRANGARFVTKFRMGDDRVNRTLYYLVHGTKHIKGGMLMKDTMVALASPGELGYAGEKKHDMVPLFDLQLHDLPNLLCEKFAGRTVTFEQVMAQTLEEIGTSTARETDYRTCLKRLEQIGRVRVRRVSSAKSGLKGKDQITFPPN